MRNLEYVLAVGLVILFALSGCGQVTATLCHTQRDDGVLSEVFGVDYFENAPSCPTANDSASATACCLEIATGELYCCDKSSFWIIIGVAGAVMVAIGGIIWGCFIFKQKKTDPGSSGYRSRNTQITVAGAGGAGMATDGGGGGGGYPMQEYTTTYPAQHTQMQMQAAYPPTAAAVDPTADSDYPTKPGTEYPASPSARPLMQADAQDPYPAQAAQQGAYPMQAAGHQPYPGQAAPQGAYPGQAAPQGAYPGQAAPQGAYPMQAAAQQYYPGQAVPQGAYPAQPVAQGAYPTQAANGAAYPPNQAATGLPPSYDDAVVR